MVARLAAELLGDIRSVTTRINALKAEITTMVRRVAAALHRIAVTQIRLDGLGRACYQHRRKGGDSKMQALRALKLRLARFVFNLLKDHQSAAPDSFPAAA